MDRRTLPDNERRSARVHRHVQILNDAKRASESRWESNAVANRVQLAYHELNIRNVHRATTVTLLRERAPDLRAVYARMWRCFADNPVTPFLYDTKEGEGSWDSRARNLKKYVDDHVREVER